MRRTKQTLFTTSLIALGVLSACAGDPAVYDDDTGMDTEDTSGDGDGDGDGDTTDDGSDATCGNGVHEAGEECDDGVEANRPDAACTPECTKNVCGDGFPLADVEECDDANLDDADGCEADCSLPACGNGIIDPGEVCYDEPVVHDLGVLYAVLETADLDHDGSADLVLLDNAEDDVGVLLGTGDGNFVAKPSVESPEESNALTLADLDDDGNLDLIVTSGRGYCFMLPCDTVPATVTWSLGDGQGGFGNTTTVEIGDTNWAVTTADLNGDGRPDVITGDQTGKALYVMMGQDSAPWLADPITVEAEGQVHGMAVGDVDGDDKPDVVAVGGSNLQIFLGNGDGTFDAQAGTELGKGLVDPWLGDVDDDGDLDILTPGKSGTVVHVLTNDGEGGFGHADEFWAGWSPHHMVVADLSQDGTLDYALANNQPNLVTVGRGLGDGTFDEVPAFEPWGGPLDLVAADFDEDGTMDLAITRPGKNAISLLLADP